MVAFHTENTGISRSNNGNCSDPQVRVDTVAVGNVTYNLEKGYTSGQKAALLGTLGWSAAFAKDSVLANLLPGAKVKLRTEGRLIYVKVGNRESAYAVVAAQGATG